MMSISSEDRVLDSEVNAELDRILQSRFLRESKQLSALLSHTVHETLAGREDGLKEYSLGLQVFHRPPDYDPRNDAIVRVQASLLRKRLAEYYEHDGHNSRLRIELPRGGYVARFQEVPMPEHLPAPPDVEARVAEVPVQMSRTGRSWRSLLIGACAGILVTAATALWLTRHSWPRPESPSLWGAFVGSKSSTVVSFGVPLFYTGGEGFFVRDIHINALTDKEGRVKRIGEILGHSFRPQEDIYTGIGDAIGTHQVAHWLEQHGVTTSLANANNVGPSDIEDKNLIVVSSARFQTLLHNMNRTDHFPFDPSSGGGAFIVLKPLPGELPRYYPTGGVGVNTSYAVISLWRGKQPHNRTLYLSGIETWSTQGAAQYAIDPDRLRDLQQRIDQDPLDGPRGKKGPFFQVLIRVEGKNNRARTSAYVTHRYLPVE